MRHPHLPTAYAFPIPIIYRAQDRVIHTDSTPYCDDPCCGCHVLLNNLETYDRHIEQPLEDGLLTTEEAHRIYWNQQI